MSSFAPSPRAAQAALGSSSKIVQREHPSGAKGVRVSMEEVAAKIRDGRLDPRVRAWAGQALVSAGKPSRVVEQSRAILAALRKQTMYTPDPVGAEFIVSAKNTLCLDDHGLCLVAGDCDDLCVALGSALLSVGIPTKIVGQSFDATGVPSHVIVAVEDERGSWRRIDPSHASYDVGEFYPATREQWVDPLEPSGLAGTRDGTMGDYIGVGGFYATPATIQAERTRINAYMTSLDVVVDRCASLPETTRLAWKAYLTGWKAYYASEPSFWGAGNESDLLEKFDKDLPGWHAQISGHCQGVPSPPKAEESTLEGVATGLKTLLIVAGVVAVVVYAVPPVLQMIQKKRG